MIRIVAVARWPWHEVGERLRFSGNYHLNPRGKPHSAFISSETIALVIYTGEPDEVHSIDVIDKA